MLKATRYAGEIGMESLGYLVAAMAGTSIGTVLGGWLARSKVAEADTRIALLESALREQAHSLDQLVCDLQQVLSLRFTCPAEQCRLGASPAISSHLSAPFPATHR